MGDQHRDDSQRTPVGMDPRARSFADGLYFELQNLLIAIPIAIVALIVAVQLDVTFNTVVLILLAAALTFAAVRWFVSWLRRELRGRS